MHIGILGTNFGAYHAHLYKNELKGHKITVYGRNTSKLVKLEKEIDCNTTTKVEDIFNNPEIDLIDICLPTSLHLHYAIKALEHGKHVFIETPVAVNPEEVEMIISNKNKYNKQVFVNMFIKYERYYEFLYEKVKSMEYGQLMVLNIYRKTPSILGSLGFNDIATSLMIHELDFVTWLLGEPNEIKSSGIDNDNSTKSHVSSSLAFDDTLVNISASSMMPNGYPFIVGFEAIFQDGLFHYHEECFENKENVKFFIFKDGKEESLDLPKRNCYADVLKQTISSIEQKTNDSRLDIEQAYKSYKLAYNIKMSLL